MEGGREGWREGGRQAGTDGRRSGRGHDLQRAAQTEDDGEEGTTRNRGRTANGGDRTHRSTVLIQDPPPQFRTAMRLISCSNSASPSNAPTQHGTHIHHSTTIQA